MKLLSDLYTDLSNEELSNTALGGDGSGVIREQDRAKIVGYANEALLRLHSRFILKKNEVLVKMFEHITQYHLLKKFAQSQQEPEAEGFFYIQDLTGEPFDEDVIKILEVWGSGGYQYPLNDPEDRWSLYTPKFNLIQATYPIMGGALSVVYQARHHVLDKDASEDEIGFVVDIPDVLYGALKAFIAYKVFSHMNTQESTAKSQEHLATYEAICAEAIDRDLVNTSISSTNTSFEKRGFV
jgi:hypothetical protein